MSHSDRLRRRLPFPVAADWLAVALAASLPWSTTATGVLVVLWLAALLPALDFRILARELRTPAGALPVLLWAFAALGMAWADVSWTERLAGLSGFHKLLAIPLMLAHFRNSDKGPWVLAAFLSACTLLLVISYFLALWPGLSWRGARFGLGVPVKDYIAQSGEFAICVFALLPIGLSMLRARPWIAVALVALATLFLIDFLYFATGRTALAVTVVLLVVFCFRQFGWRSGVAVLLAAAAGALVVWESSSFLRTRVGILPAEIERYWKENTPTPAGERLEFWRKSVLFIRDAPVFGHGTGTIANLFRRAAVGEKGPAALQSTNPHNEVFVAAIQLGVVGVALLCAMWAVHLALFCAPGLPAWIGLLIVIQNMVSSLFNSHLSDFTQGWIYVVGVGVAGGTLLRCRAKVANPAHART
jgi:O-antigen ligase